MSTRTVYGNTRSENGWPMVDTGSCTWVTIPGTDVTLQIQNGQPLSILRAFAADLNAYVEPMRDADSACWTLTNSVSTSNHLSGTAFDYNWESHPFRASDAGFSTTQIATIRELLDWYEGTVFWGNDWTSPKDAMHYQVGYNTFGNAHTADFIARKLRADGYSAFRRTADTSAGVSVLAEATGLSVDRCTTLLPAITAGLQHSECTTALRVAMWLAQIGHESGSFVYTEEIASGAAYEGRLDLGNTQPDDGVRFKGRTWIQITGRNNYAQFSQWAAARGIVDSPTYFVDNPTHLAELQYAGLGAAWYWTVARPDINALCDAGDLTTVTRRINGGTNGLADRKARYERALAVVDQLLALTTTTFLDDLEALLMSTETYASRSIYRSSNTKTMRAIDALFGADACSHMDWVEQSALRGEQWAIALVAATAAGTGAGATQYWDTTKVDPWAVTKAQNVLSRIESTNPEYLQTYLKGA